MLYAMLLALFLPLGLLFSHFDQQQYDLEQGKLQSMLFYVDQLRVALPIYRVTNPEKKEGEVKFKDLEPYFPLDLAKRSGVKQYIDDQGFYIVWNPPIRGLAHALVKHYSRASGESAHLVFYHIGFTEKRSGTNCLVPSRRYQQPILSPNTCTWPLPASITEGDLVLTDREPL
jgi:hypothetical protein